MLLLLWLPDERDASLSSFELLSCVVLLVYPTSGYGDVFFGFLLWFVASVCSLVHPTSGYEYFFFDFFLLVCCFGLLYWFARRAGTTISSLVFFLVC